MKQAIFSVSLLSLLISTFIGITQERSLLTEQVPIVNQAKEFPLFTKLLPKEVEKIKEAFRFGKFQKKNVVALRPRLLTLAQAGDPMAQFYYATTYDLYEFGQGNAEDGKVALEWYLKAANQKYAHAEFFLYHVYAYGLMQLPRDPKQAFHWLHRTYLHSASTLKAEVALELARQTSTEHSTIPAEARPHSERLFQYLQEAHQLDPKNQTAIDWLFDEQIKRKTYQEALLLADKSQNPFTWRRMGELCLSGGPGFAPNLKQALSFLKRAAEVELRDGSDLYPGWKSLMLLYSMVCQKRLQKESLGALNNKTAWQHFHRFQQNCVIPSGG